MEIDLADRAVVGANLRLQAGEAFENLLAIPVVLRLVVEDESEAGEAEDGDGAQMIEMRDAESNQERLFRAKSTGARITAGFANFDYAIQKCSESASSR